MASFEPLVQQSLISILSVGFQLHELANFLFYSSYLQLQESQLIQVPGKQYLINGFVFLFYRILLFLLGPLPSVRTTFMQIMQKKIIPWVTMGQVHVTDGFLATDRYLLTGERRRREVKLIILSLLKHVLEEEFVFLSDATFPEI